MRSVSQSGILTRGEHGYSPSDVKIASSLDSCQFEKREPIRLVKDALEIGNKGKTSLKLSVFERRANLGRQNGMFPEADFSWPEMDFPVAHKVRRHCAGTIHTVFGNHQRNQIDVFLQL